jgi:SAM-dependent methyltransferase
VTERSDTASFQKPAATYDRFVGRYSDQLARAFVDRLDLAADAVVLDVGCGPGALTAVLAERVGPQRVAAVEPSEQFAAACRARVPEADVHVAGAEALPFADGAFDATLSQLVVNFLPDPDAGLRELRRVTRPGGAVAAVVWDYAGEMTMLRAFWDAALELDPQRAGPLDEGKRFPDCNPDRLAALWTAAGFEQVRTAELVVSAAYADFDDLWAPFTAGVGPAGSYCASLGDDERAGLANAFHRRLGSPYGSFELAARAWMVAGSD